MGPTEIGRRRALIFFTIVVARGDGQIVHVGVETVHSVFNNFSTAVDAPTTFQVTGTSITDVVCYARGTMIRTPAGELPVEKLRPGKQVSHSDRWPGGSADRYLRGHRHIGLDGHPRPETVAPIRIRRDAFADGMPHRDLVVPPDHAIFVDGKLICARQLVNGTTIRQELDWTAVDYYHIELDQHAILLAEGLPAESYLDTGNSGFFANSGVPLVLHPDLTDEIEYPTRDRVIFVLPRGVDEVSLLSRAQSSTEARPWLEDRRRLGVRVKRIMLRVADQLRQAGGSPRSHPRLVGRGA